MPLSNQFDMPDFPIEFSDEEWLRSALGSWTE
jgi:hypothetical protein